MTRYVRPLVGMGPDRPKGALTLAGGWCWFDTVEILERGEPPHPLPAQALPGDVRARLTVPRAAIAGLDMGKPHVMAILNVTPDSFSDGGDFIDPVAATAQAQAHVTAGATILDIGGESTRPGAVEVPEEEEIGRVAPVIAAARDLGAVISIDTRKAPVAQAAIAAGAGLINDVAAMTFDAQMEEVVADSGLPVCLMHAQGTPADMQDAPSYDEVLLDVYDWLEARIDAAEAAGIPRARIIADPGIGFGKTLDHNLALLRGLSLFHALGCPILLGASRKRFIGTLGGAPAAKDRLGGSVAVALHGLRQGVQITRVHDTLPTKQAFDLQLALSGV